MERPPASRHNPPRIRPPLPSTGNRHRQPLRLRPRIRPAARTLPPERGEHHHRHACQTRPQHHRPRRTLRRRSSHHLPPPPPLPNQPSHPLLSWWRTAAPCWVALCATSSIGQRPMPLGSRLIHRPDARRLGSVAQTGRHERRGNFLCRNPRSGMLFVPQRQIRKARPH